MVDKAGNVEPSASHIGAIGSSAERMRELV